MPVLARFRLTTPILRRTLERTEVAEIRFENYCVDNSGKIGLRYWIVSSSIEEFENGLEADETVSSYEVLTREASRYLFQTRLSEAGREKSFVPLLGEFGGELVDGKRTNGAWAIRLCFPDHATLQEFFDTFRSVPEISIQLNKLHRVDSFERRSSGVTPSQREALQTACERGYFDVPRRTTLKELSEDLNISDQALSERLRRAHRRVYDQMFD